MKRFVISIALSILLVGCSLFRGEGQYYPGYTCEYSLMHFHSYCSNNKLSKEELETEIKTCEEDFATKVCEKEQADLLWCLGRVSPGMYTRGGGIYGKGFYGGGGSTMDGCDCSWFEGALRLCRLQRGVYSK
jgi:hypothetical protein